MLTKLLKPSFNVLEGVIFCDIINQQGSYSITVVGVCYRSIALLTSCIPDLSSHELVLHLDAPSCKFNTNGGLGSCFKLVLCVTEEEVRLPYSGVADEDNFK